MSSFVTNNMNSAIVSAQFGLNKAYEGMTQASMNIAQRAAQTNVAQDGPTEMLANASLQSLGNMKQILPQSATSMTDDLVSLQLNSINAQASAKVLGVANDTIGKIIDTLA